MRSYFLCRVLAGLVTATLVAGPVAAQLDESAHKDESGKTVEEIVIYGSRSGDPVKADPAYEEMLRMQALEEVQRMRREEEEAWRNSNLTYKSSPESRIVWGYDPKADRDRYESLDSNSLSGESTKPATLFRAQF